MTVSMRVMSAGDGYRYLLKSVVVGDGDRDLSTPLTRYYTEKGYPPGWWVGSGLAGLGSGEIIDGDTVSEEQLALLLGAGRDPITGDELGQAFRRPESVSDRIERRIRDLNPDMTPGEQAEAVARIETDERVRGSRRVVAGYDYTFSVPKSVSTLWAVADAGTQALIVEAHHAAVRDVLDLMERDVVMTRVGHAGVGQIETRGIIATAFDHYDSRSADPQLHTHVVVANKVQGVDGVWRSIDGRPMHAAVVALSEHYNNVLADRLTSMFGLAWDQRLRGRDRNRVWEIAGVPEPLIEAFSSRSQDIEKEKDRLIEQYVAEHGRQPTSRTVIRLRQQATLSTRPDKTLRSLAELTATWRAQATAILGEDAPTWAMRITSENPTVSGLRADDLALGVIADIAAVVVDQTGQRRSTWRRWNLHAEASRQTAGFRFASTMDREAVVGLIVDAAENLSLRLTPPEFITMPTVFRRSDGSSIFRPRNHVTFSSTLLLEAEDRLLELASSMAGPTVTQRHLDRVLLARHGPDARLGDDQRAVIAKLATSGRVLDVMVGPAGSGKTTALGGLRRAWEAEHGDGTVVGLAPSAAAAQVLADDLGVRTENTAKWLYEHQRGKWNLNAGQLVIVDEASLAGTLTLDAITRHAAEVGAKVVLVGDWAQLAAVESGGAFGMLVRDRHDVPELTEIRRFTADWEKTASLHLRLGHATALDTYQANDRLREGDSEEIIDAAYTAWQKDLAEGLSSVLIAESRETVTALNLRARIDRIANGDVEADGVALHDGTMAGRGDLIITRANNRRLTAGRGWVKNGDRWRVLHHHHDGSLTVRRENAHFGATVTLPAAYVATDAELAYAITAHRAQGSTVDTAHALVDGPAMTRESFYVAMTRGRHSNIAYAATDIPSLEEHQLDPDAEPSAISILRAVLQHETAEKSAHETITAEQEAWTGIGHLADQYETIAQQAQAERFTASLTRAGMTATELELIAASDVLGPMIADLREAEAVGHDPDDLIERAVQAGGLDQARDLPTVVRHRVATLAAAPPPRGRRPTARLIAGLIPEATGPMPDDIRTVLDDLSEHIARRARNLATQAIENQDPWLTALGPEPENPRRRQTWRNAVIAVAAYRDRHHITDPTPLGPPSAKADRIRIQRTLHRLAQKEQQRRKPERTVDAQYVGPSM